MENENKEFALAISGGGYRAALFALGSLWRLNELGLLARINRITSVSGGSITSGYLAMSWDELNFSSDTNVANNFKEVIAIPLQEFYSKGLDIVAVILGILSPTKSIGDKVADAYSRRLFNLKTLQDIPAPGEGPEFIFYATNLQTGASVRISKSYIADYKVGMLPVPEMGLAQVVGASSAFPPVLSPVTIKCNPDDWERTEGAFLYDNEEYRERIVLTDGGVYDNMGLEAVWNDGFNNVFVCNAGAPFKVKKRPRKNWFSQSLRVTSIITEQTRALRKRTLIDNYKKMDKNGNHLVYGGAYWGIKCEIDSYNLEDSMVKDNKMTMSLKNIRTRLNGFSQEDQGHLINWGYALADTALRRWYYSDQQVAGEWPIPEYGLDKFA